MAFPKPQKWEKVGYYLTCMPETLGWYTHQTYTGHTLKKTDEGWLLIVRCEGKKGRKVSFTHARSIVDCVAGFAHLLASNQINWKNDLY